jgi:hypothetical protein
MTDAKRLFGLNTGYYQRLKLPLLRAEVHSFFLKLHQRYIISLKRTQGILSIKQLTCQSPTTIIPACACHAIVL